MALCIGARLGPYEMSALKILPDTFTHDPERLARFRREAQVPAALNRGIS